MKIHKTKFHISISLLASFILWTFALRLIDLQPIGPEDSVVGFATLNAFFHKLTGVHLVLYTLTDWLSLIPVGICAGFGLLGLFQWISRKALRCVDFDLLALGTFYAVVFAVYASFEVYIVNYRPVLINGILEASYPSSTTMLVICVMGSAILQFQMRINNIRFRKFVTHSSMIYLISMVSLRLLSGVHWMTDIIGGILLSISLVMMYASVITVNEK